MGVAKILVTQEYTHAYHMWKSIKDDDHTWVRFKAHFQKAYLDREELEQMARATGYGSTKYAKYGEMEDAFMNFASTTAAQGTDVSDLDMTNRNLSTKLRYQEDHIWALPAEFCNLKVAAETWTTDMKGSNNTVQPYAREKKQKLQWPTDLTGKFITT